jgi:hypothetical protein
MSARRKIIVWFLGASAHAFFAAPSISAEIVFQTPRFSTGATALIANGVQPASFKHYFQVGVYHYGGIDQSIYTPGLSFSRLYKPFTQNACAACSDASLTDFELRYQLDVTDKIRAFGIVGHTYFEHLPIYSTGLAGTQIGAGLEFAISPKWHLQLGYSWSEFKGTFEPNTTQTDNLFWARLTWFWPFFSPKDPEDPRYELLPGHTRPIKTFGSLPN